MSLKLEELNELIQAAEPAAVLVSPRILGRVIQQALNLPSQFVNVPHRKSFVVERSVLFRHVEQDELEMDADRLLPAHVILLVRPTAEKLQLWGGEATLAKYWRLLFHANIHLAVERKFADGKLTLEDIHHRIDQIGQTEYDEIRAVLRQETYLPRDADERMTYIEFAAVYFELKFFLTNLRALYFPAIGDFARIDSLLSQDVNADAIFIQSRLPGAPKPVIRSDDSSDEPEDYYRQLVNAAKRAAKAGNTVRAAILRTRAARVAPASLAQETKTLALIDLQRLTERLQVALKLDESVALDWLRVLPALLEKADQGRWAVEAHLLYDLQQVCVDHEKDIFTLDILESLRSGGKRPMKRALPSQRLVRMTKNLRRALQRLAMARLTDQDRQQLAKLLQSAVGDISERLRTRFRPIIGDALHDVGLKPASPPEDTAKHNLIEEMLDRITQFGFLTFRDVRAALARNQLKLPDLSEPQEFIHGDPLLRLDRRLGTALDGVYRPSELYLRLVQRLTSLNFATSMGRWVTRNLTIPAAGAVVVLDGTQRLVEHMSLQVPVFGPLTWLAAWWTADSEITSFGSLVIPLTCFLVLGAWLLALMRLPALRRGGKVGLARTGQAVRCVLIDLPRWLMSFPMLRNVVTSWPFHVVYWYGIKPLVVSALIWLLIPVTYDGVLIRVATFLVVNYLLNSPLGRAGQELAMETVFFVYAWLRADFFHGLYRLVVQVFKRIFDSVENVYYAADEYLRFRSGDSRISLAARAIGNVIWFPIAYVSRFAIFVLIEPWLNPLKFPVVIVAATFQMVFETRLLGALDDPLSSVVGAVDIARVILVLLPGAVGFLFWEMKEGWRLYSANRAVLLGPALIGSHDETMVQLLRPGFYSGTLPKLYASLRWAERHAYKTGEWRRSRTYRQSLNEVVIALRRFAERQLVYLLQHSPAWTQDQLRVGWIDLAGNRITMELQHADASGPPAQMTFEEVSGWLVAGVVETGWLKTLTPAQGRPFMTALIGFYHWAGVHFVREQIRSALPPDAVYDITSNDLVVWLNGRLDREINYRWPQDGETFLLPRKSKAFDTELKALDVRQVFFARSPITWNDWTQTWRVELSGQDQSTLPSDGARMLIPPSTPTFCGFGQEAARNS
jgi:hypothetical protein